LKTPSIAKFPQDPPFPARLAAAGLLCLALAAGAAWFPAASWAQGEDEFDPLSLIDTEKPGPPPGAAAPSTAPAAIPAPAAPPADVPALVLDSDPVKTSPDPLEAVPGAGEADLSAPGMTGSAGGTIPIMLVESAYLAHRRGDFKAAIDGYTSIIRRRGLTKRERAISYLLRGEAKRDDGQPGEAILDFTRALRQWPGYPAAHYFRGRIYEKRNQLNDAYADLAMAAQLDPLREAYQTTLSLLKVRLKEAGLLSDGPPPRPNEPRLPEE
jgi:tetratricopeptide (TPR) repeat protein